VEEDWPDEETPPLLKEEEICIELADDDTG